MQLSDLSPPLACTRKHPVGVNRKFRAGPFLHPYLFLTYESESSRHHLAFYVFKIKQTKTATTIHMRAHAHTHPHIQLWSSVNKPLYVCPNVSVAGTERDWVSRVAVIKLIFHEINCTLVS